jgi:hypothetical protein
MTYWTSWTRVLRWVTIDKGYKGLAGVECLLLHGAYQAKLLGQCWRPRYVVTLTAIVYAVVNLSF